MSQQEEKYLNQIEPILEQNYQGKRFSTNEIIEKTNLKNPRKLGHTLSHIEKQYKGLHKIKRGHNQALTLWFYNSKRPKKKYSEQYQEKLGQQKIAKLTKRFTKPVSEQHGIEGTKQNLYENIVKEIENSENQAITSEKATNCFNNYIEVQHGSISIMEKTRKIGELRGEFLEKYDEISYLDGEYVLEG